MTKRVIILFLDGVGLGEADPEANPFMQIELPALQELLGVKHLTRQVAGAITGQAALLGLDATLGVPGLPQSATGQTTILTGQNAARLLGEHYGPYPNERLRDLLRRDNLFKTLLDQNYPVAYANAYPTRFLDRLRRGKGRLSANTQAAFMSGLKLRSSHDLRQGRALSAVIRNDRWPEPEVKLPWLSARQAGGQLVALAEEHALTFFEFWYTDLVGHKQDQIESSRTLRLLDDFIGGLVERMDRCNTLLLVISDHGNFEDWTTGKHTLNPALALVTGAGFSEVAARLHTLADIKGAVLNYLMNDT